VFRLVIQDRGFRRGRVEFGRAAMRQREGLAFLHAELGHAEGHPTGVAPRYVARGPHRCEGWLMPG
jgi:hypothetical protein